jgi:hypothetical protein
VSGRPSVATPSCDVHPPAAAPDLLSGGTRPSTEAAVRGSSSHRPARRRGGDSDGGLTHRVATVPPGVPGDSGSGYLDGDGEAFGVLSTQIRDGGRTSNGVADLALAYANRYGDIGTVSLVPGTEPFALPG